MIDDEVVTITRKELSRLNDRVLIAEDRIRVIREVYGRKKNLPWYPMKWLRMLRRIKLALA